MKIIQCHLFLTLPLSPYSNSLLVSVEMELAYVRARGPGPKVEFALNKTTTR